MMGALSNNVIGRKASQLDRCLSRRDGRFSESVLREPSLCRRATEGGTPSKTTSHAMLSIHCVEVTLDACMTLCFLLEIKQDYARRRTLAVTQASRPAISAIPEAGRVGTGAGIRTVIVAVDSAQLSVGSAASHSR